jgi:alkylated DNA repair dioxygenase AlkB
MSAPEGLVYEDDVIPGDLSERLGEWLATVEGWERVGGASSRRVLQFGSVYRYSHIATRGDKNRKAADRTAPPFPDILLELVQLIKARTAGAEPDQCIINEYLPGQGIAAHTDSPHYFGETIWCFSIGGGVEMEFTPSEPSHGASPYYQYVEPNSLYIMNGEARYEWLHCMRPRLTDPVRASDGQGSGITTRRQTRYSLTFRTMRQ